VMQSVGHLLGCTRKQASQQTQRGVKPLGSSPACLTKPNVDFLSRYLRLPHVGRMDARLSTRG